MKIVETCRNLIHRNLSNYIVKLVKTCRNYFKEFGRQLYPTPKILRNKYHGPYILQPFTPIDVSWHQTPITIIFAYLGKFYPWHQFDVHYNFHRWILVYNLRSTHALDLDLMLDVIDCTTRILELRII